MKQRHKVVALPIDKASNLHLQLSTKQWLFYGTGEHKGNNDIIPHCIYFTSDEEIKEGDWILDKMMSTNIWVPYQVRDKLESKTAIDYNRRKIVATTNPELWDIAQYDGSKYIGDKRIGCIGEDFIQAFVREQGIWEVLLEMEEY